MSLLTGICVSVRDGAGFNHGLKGNSIQTFYLKKAWIVGFILMVLTKKNFSIVSLRFGVDVLIIDPLRN